MPGSVIHGPHADIILNELGFGPYHISIFLLIMMPIALAGMHSLNYVFTAGEVDYRCLVPECEVDPPSFEPDTWREFALPPAPQQRCFRHRPLSAACTKESFAADLVQCTEYLYANDLTIVPEFNLACSEWKRTSVGTIHSLAIIVSLPITGYVSDTLGRRTAFVLTSSILKVGGLMRAFADNYLIYVILEFIDSALTSGNFMSGFILYIEMLKVDQRVRGGNNLHITFAVGQALLAFCAWGYPYWRTLTVIIYAPCIFFVINFFLLDESARWLLTKGKIQKAAKVIERAAKVNGKTLTPETLQALNAAQRPPSLTRVRKWSRRVGDFLEKTRDTIMGQPNDTEETVMYQVMKSKILMLRLFVCSIWWVTVNLIYYGLSINSVSIAGNKYINFALISLVEVPGYLLATRCLDKFGRRRSIMAALLVCGVAQSVQSLLEFCNKQGFSIALALMSKLSISMVFASLFIYTAELFPTAARGRLMAVCSMLGRVGLLLAPQTPLLMSVHVAAPWLLFAASALVAAALVYAAPETLWARLPDTVAEAERAVRRVTLRPFIHQSQPTISQMSSLHRQSSQTSDSDIR